MLQLRQKIGVGFVILGLLLLIFSFIQITPFFSNSEVVINPVPLAALAESIQQQDIQIDNQTPIKNYLSTINGNNTTYTNPFLLSFPTLHLQDIVVTPNVDSSKPSQYESILAHSVAQFKGTALPGQSGNIFIYGHSSIPWFHRLYPHAYEGIFTALFDLKIGDTINITIEKNTFNYVIEGITTTNATDFSQIDSIAGIKTLTLMTCSPPGIGTKRLIIRALQI